MFRRHVAVVCRSLAEGKMQYWFGLAPVWLFGRTLQDNGCQLGSDSNWHMLTIAAARAARAIA
jgi:hypothetical protein